MISDVFHQDDGVDRLRARLSEAKDGGAELAILPELAMNRWAPATREARDDDAEEPGGPRHQAQRDAAKDIGIALVGASLVRNPNSGERRNTALIFDARGELLGTYAKCHIPEEPGFWETSHYGAANDLDILFNQLPMPLGVQICSDNNRPEGTHLLAALGAELVVNPRASEEATYHKWRHAWIANAWTSAVYVLSPNRPAPEDGVLLGGPSIAVAPDGEVIAESTDPVVTVELSRSAIEQARRDYPGYLPVRADQYARAWAKIADMGNARLRGYPRQPEDWNPT